MTNARNTSGNSNSSSNDQDCTSTSSGGSSSSTTRPLHLDELPLEILLLIFDYCHAFDLVRLSSVCTRFYDVAHDEMLWYKRSKRTLATNQVSKRFRSRCNPLLSSRSKWQVTHNWEYGCYQRNVLFSQRSKLMPWLQLTGDVLWWSGGNELSGFIRNEPFNQRGRIYHENTRSDVCKFIVRDEFLISGHRDGSIKFWLKNLLPRRGSNFYHSIERAHSRDVDAIEETGDLILSGSADGCIKAWTSPKTHEFISNIPLASMRFNDRIWSLCADPTGTMLAVGSSGNAGPPLYVCDTADFGRVHHVSHPWRQGAGILDMVWDDPHTLLTCGYDTCVRKWDLRSGKCVSSWSDPTDATIYCISSDYNYTMVTGTQFNCKAVLWDQRKPHYVQLYFMNLRRMSSPIYSISFDSSHLYGATDQNVVEVKFTGQPNVEKNYRETIKYEKFLSVER